MRTQVEKVYHLVLRKPGLTATQYTRLLGFKHFKNPTGLQNKDAVYKPATILRELHRLVERGYLEERKEPGVRHSVIAWRFYPA